MQSRTYSSAGSVFDPSVRRRLALCGGILSIGLAFGCAKLDAVKCDAEVLREEVARVQALREEKPAWFGDLSADHHLGFGLARDVLIRACPDLPPELRRPIDDQSAYVRDERSVELGPDPTSTEVARFRRRRARICVDPTVFDEIPTMPAEQRGPEMVRRCQPEKVGLGDITAEVISRLGLNGLMVYQAMVDGGTPAELARDALGLFVYPAVPKSIGATLPHSDTNESSLREGIIVHISATEVSLPGGPRFPSEGGEAGDTARIRDWLAVQLDDAYGVSNGQRWTVNLFAQADAAASTVTRVAQALPGPTYVLAVRQGEDDFYYREELVADANETAPPSYVLTVTSGQLEVRNTATDEVELRVPHEGDLSPLERWAAGVSSEVSVELDAKALTVQQFVSIRQALRGSECSLLLWKTGEEPPPGCNVIFAPLRG